MNNFINNLSLTFNEIVEKIAKFFSVICRYDNRAFITAVLSMILDIILVYFIGICDILIITVLYQLSIICILTKHGRELEDNIYYYRYELFDTLYKYDVELSIKMDNNFDYIFVLSKHNYKSEISFTDDRFAKAYPYYDDDSTYEELLNIIKVFSEICDENENENK